MQRKNTIIGLFTLLILLTGSALFAQMSDQQVIQELRKYENSGMSPQEVATELTKKGATPSQLQRVHGTRRAKT